MSRFAIALPVLIEASDKAPLFMRMLLTGEAWPMQTGIGAILTRGKTKPRRQEISRALATLCRSKRYLEAVAAPGAQRYDLNGEAVAPVTVTHQLFAIQKRADIMRMYETKSTSP